MNLRRNPRDIEYPWVRARLSGYSGAQILDVGCVGGPIMDRYEAIGFDFRPGAEHWSERHVRQWFDAAKLTVEEWLVVTGVTWAIGTGQSEARQVLLAAGVKSG